jgi:hypothetical protein
MSYPTSAAGTGQMAGNPSAIAKPRLHEQIETLNKTLAVCHQSARDLEQIADRILGPVPENVSKDAPKPATDTIERKLTETQENLDALSGRLLHAVQRLNSAV